MPDKTLKSLKARRIALGMSQEAAAAALGVSASTWRRFEGAATVERMVDLSMEALEHRASIAAQAGKRDNRAPPYPGRQAPLKWNESRLHFFADDDGHEVHTPERKALPAGVFLWVQYEGAQAPKPGEPARYERYVTLGAGRTQLVAWGDPDARLPPPAWLAELAHTEGATWTPNHAMPPPAWLQAMPAPSVPSPAAPSLENAIDEDDLLAALRADAVLISPITKP